MVNYVEVVISQANESMVCPVMRLLQPRRGSQHMLPIVLPFFVRHVIAFPGKRAQDRHNVDDVPLNCRKTINIERAHEVMISTLKKTVNPVWRSPREASTYSPAFSGFVVFNSDAASCV